MITSNDEAAIDYKAGGRSVFICLDSHAKDQWISLHVSSTRAHTVQPSLLVTADV